MTKGEEKGVAAGVAEDAAGVAAGAEMEVDEDVELVGAKGVDPGVGESADFADAPSFQSSFLRAFLNSACVLGALSHRID